MTTNGKIRTWILAVLGAAVVAVFVGGRLRAAAVRHAADAKVAQMVQTQLERSREEARKREARSKASAEKAEAEWQKYVDELNLSALKQIGRPGKADFPQRLRIVAEHGLMDAQLALELIDQTRWRAGVAANAAPRQVLAFACGEYWFSTGAEAEAVLAQAKREFDRHEALMAIRAKVPDLPPPAERSVHAASQSLNDKVADNTATN